MGICFYRSARWSKLALKSPQPTTSPVRPKHCGTAVASQLHNKRAVITLKVHTLYF